MTYTLTERTWPSLILNNITVNNHLVTVTSTLGIKVKQKVVLSKLGLDTKEFEVKRVLDNVTIMIGPVGSNIKKVSEAIPYDGGTLHVPEQSRNKLGDTPILRAVYEEEPTIALRTIGVDPFGQYYTESNPFPVQLSESLALFVQNPLIQNIVIPTANVEQTINLPINTKRFLVKARGNSKLNLSFNLGDSSTNFLTLYPGYEYTENNVGLLTQLFIQSSKANEVLEIVTWQ